VTASTAIVSGATGFIGRNLTAALQAKGVRVLALVRRKDESLPCEQAVWGKKLDEKIPADSVFFHLAAYRYDATAFRTSQHDLLKQNTALSMAAYEFCLAHDIKEIRVASSIAVYGQDETLLDDAKPLNLNTMPYASEAMYGWGKRMGEVAAELHREKYGLNTLSFRLSNPYGPLDEQNADKAHVVPAFIIRALTTQGPFPVRGNPKAVRDFVYVDDVVKVLIASLDKKETTAAYNLGSGTSTTIQDLARAILARTGGTKRDVVAAGQATGDVVAREVSVRRLRNDFGMTDFTPLESGLDKTIAWYKNALNT
jgi:nucleoside-diphosphate-sugar epimerase